MKGNNSIVLNQATMIDAIQHYFNTVAFKCKVKVVHVKKSTEHLGCRDDFEIDFAESQPDTTAQEIDKGNKRD